MFDAHICIVSTWGRGYIVDENITEFKEFLISRGIIINGLEIGDPDWRADYVIKRKLEGWTKFLIIDDESLEYYKKVDEIGFNRILATNSFRCLDNYDLVTVSRNYNRLISDYPINY
jgi:hypothetical protein